MADTRTQLDAEDWVRRHWMPQQFGQQFRRERLQLSAGGVFDFDAVSADNKIIAAISTSSGATAGGKHPVGKLMKLRADMLFLLMAEAEQRLIVLTERDMYELCLKEKQGGRVPREIQFVNAQIPDELGERLRRAKSLASREVRPGAPE